MTHLDQIVNALTKKHVYIQTHNFPDPDAISSAFGLKYLLKEKGIESTLCYKGKIDRYSTIQMIEILGIEIYNLEDLKDISEYNEVILVDAQKGNANIIDMPGEEVVCIDHHPTFEKIEYIYSDIRPELGACASIIASYYYESGIEMRKDVATALLYGIRIDTAGLTRGGDTLDYEMFYKMSDLGDNELIASLTNNSIHYDELKAYSNAINSIKVFGDISFANTGKECPETLIASISDFILSLIEIRFSVVYSIKKDGIKLSIRNEIPELDAGKISFEALKNIGSGGGHATMAGGYVPLENVKYDEDEKIKIIIDKIQECFLTEIEKVYKIPETDI